MQLVSRSLWRLDRQFASLSSLFYTLGAHVNGPFNAFRRRPSKLRRVTAIDVWGLGTQAAAHGSDGNFRARRSCGESWIGTSIRLGPGFRSLCSIVRIDDHSLILRDLNQSKPAFFSAFVQNSQLMRSHWNEELLCTKQKGFACMIEFVPVSDEVFSSLSVEKDRGAAGALD